MFESYSNSASTSGALSRISSLSASSTITFSRSTPLTSPATFLCWTQTNFLSLTAYSAGAYKQMRRQKISPVGDWQSTSLDWRFSMLDPWIGSWPWPWIRPYGIPSCITHRPLAIYEISLRSEEKNFQRSPLRFWSSSESCDKQEAQLMLTTGSTCLAVSPGQQTWYHSTCYI